MELREYLRVVRRHWLLILVPAAVCVVAAAALTHRPAQSYASESEVFVSTPPVAASSAYTQGLFTQQRVTAYGAIVRGRELAQRVVHQLGLPLSASAVADKISTSVSASSGLIRVTVTDSDAGRAQQINEAAVIQLRKMVAQIERSASPAPTGQAKAVIRVTVIDPPSAAVSSASSTPLLRNLGLGLIVGLLIGAVLTLLREQFDTTVRDLGKVPGLREVPILGTFVSAHDVSKRPLITDLASEAPRVEAVRVLRTNLHFLASETGSKAYVITSALAGDGKSTTVTNLAIAAAATGDKVLLVDANLRRPEVDDLLGLDGSAGLSSVLAEGTTLDGALQEHAASGLSVLTSGPLPPNPAELLQGAPMERLLANLKSRFDLILVDTPPLLSVTDAAVVAGRTDGALLVVRQSKVTEDQLILAVERLRAVGAPVLGVVLNRVARRSGGGRGYRYTADRTRADRPRGGARRSGAGWGGSHTRQASGDPFPES